MSRDALDIATAMANFKPNMKRFDEAVCTIATLNIALELPRNTERAVSDAIEVICDHLEYKYPEFKKSTTGTLRTSGLL